MKTAILTTDTVHHAYFVRELASRDLVDLVLAEDVGVSNQPVHQLDRDRDDHERSRWFGGGEAVLGEYCEALEVPSVNSDAAIDVLRKAAPDVVVVFGTGILRAPVIDVCGEGLVNLHGGHPERYRGLDSHLWAIYHSDLRGLVTTLHRVDRELDTGDVVLAADLPLGSCEDLSELRAVNTELCVDLVVSAVEMRRSVGRFMSRRQATRGRYYSAMPNELKDVCVKRFLSLVGKR